MVKNYFILSLLLLSYVTRVFSQELSVDSFYSANRQETLKTLLTDDSIVCSCLVDSVVVYHDYSIAILQVQDTASQKRFTVVAKLAQFGTTDVSKMAGQVYKLYFRRVPPLKRVDNSRVITYVAAATSNNGPLFINADEIVNDEIYYLQSFADISVDSSIHPNQVKFHTLEDMYYAAVDAFLTIGRNRQLIAKDVPIYVSSEHFYTPFRMLADKRELPDGMDFCTESELKKKITIKHPYVYCWYFGTQVHDDTLTIWAWTPYFKKKGANVKGTLCTYYWMIFQYQDDGWVLLNANVSQV